MPANNLPTPTSYHQLFAYRGLTVPDSPWFHYPEPVTADKYRVLTYKGADDLISHLAAQYADVLPERNEHTISSNAPKSLPEAPMVVATLGSNNVQLALTGLAAQRLQHAYIHVSPLNSDTGIVTLLKTVDARVLLADDVFYERAEKLAAQIEGLQLHRMISFDPVDELKKDLRTFAYDINKDESKNSGLIFHTSGTSSSAPKPIWHANASFMHIPPMGVLRTTLTTGLMYHGMGGGIVLMAANISGSVALPLAKDPNYRTIPEVINSLKALPQIDVIVLHPILIEAFWENYGRNNSPEMEYLKRIGRIETGGGKLAHSVAHAMRSAGVNVRTLIGATEVGPFPLRNEPTEENWDSFVVTNEDQAVWEHIEGDQYELLLQSPPALALNLGIPPDGIYRTNDVFEEIPAGSKQYVYVGRRDQMLIHTMGLNTNPVSWENEFRPLDIVEECQLVGHGRRGPLLLVELNWSLVKNEQEARERVWKEIERINDTVMAWSRVQNREAMVILPRGAKLERSDKETVKRGVNLKKFENEIEQGYANWDKAAPLAKA
ncbi:hypothetical protein INT43_008699 [Umbelopsis isabellina]|uniref:AMP-dependent synthetase/ligase domain-containing protein n=1 Tax=Mortierella isabellina TaxID=91625 RepID=A0A8H7UGT0_MORIS|nr:hypothetical protein INT43_008699 [Umbelopsis isabellina]